MRERTDGSELINRTLNNDHENDTYTSAYSSLFVLPFLNSEHSEHPAISAIVAFLQVRELLSWM